MKYLSFKIEFPPGYDYCDVCPHEKNCLWNNLVEFHLFEERNSNEDKERTSFLIEKWWREMKDDEKENLMCKKVRKQLASIEIYLKAFSSYWGGR
jgi:hypothetical protein